MERQLEPELMDDPAGAAAYARADFHDSDDLFVAAVRRCTESNVRTVLDLGCGPGALTIRLAQALPGVSLTAVDGSAAMIALARDAVQRAGLDTHVTLLQERLQDLRLPAGAFDAVLSKDLLHHLPEASTLWTTVARLARRDAAVCVMDLIRPDSQEAARQIVDRVAGSADPILQQDFYNSLGAAFSLEEVRAQLASAGLPLRVETIGDRHLLITGRR